MMIDKAKSLKALGENLTEASRLFQAMHWCGIRGANAHFFDVDHVSVSVVLRRGKKAEEAGGEFTVKSSSKSLADAVDQLIEYYPEVNDLFCTLPEE